MELKNLGDMTKGWFVGSFIPTVLNTNSCEVAIKKYKIGESEPSHFHKVATEVTVVLSGRCEMNGVQYKENDIIVIHPNEATDFKALEDTVTVVVKEPSVAGDKYLS